VRLAVLAAILATGILFAAMRRDVIEGNAGSPVKVIIYGDLQCPDCAKLRTLLDEKILPKYGSRVAFIHRDFPLGRHEWARQAAMVGRWVYEQDPEAGIAFRREIMSEQNSITGQNLKPWLTEFAARNKLDQRGIVAAIGDARLSALVDQDLAAGAARSVTRVPVVFVGGQTLVETIVEDDFVQALESALK
jgi:protein-disulfide isomerase